MSVKRTSFIGAIYVPVVRGVGSDGKTEVAPEKRQRMVRGVNLTTQRGKLTEVVRRFF